MMVAWHEMPGTGTIEIRSVGYGMIGLSGVDRLAENKFWRRMSHRSLRDGSRLRAFPGISCQATIMLSLRDSIFE